MNYEPKHFTSEDFREATRHNPVHSFSSGPITNSEKTVCKKLMETWENLSKEQKKVLFDTN